ncbi:hypothetical protein GGS23DRAFT_205663 [Durotheca rogersii]|uniref:uncharacterized protein n=1 Tax=Durotheca rogersii TaxID=419775 RepID=UPI00222127D2|nr:uncharacterized protein GGS23DRAFT_205663 [Durotheca rogersii]KAI5861033.1 hypothetical protein GGS23DRAFT_205663 [Durotheca rogersii]
MGSLPPPAGIQTIDISTLINSNDPVARKAKADELVAAIHIQGACAIVGHGIKVDRMREALDWSRKFFDLPYEEKAKANHPNGIVPHRGYSGIGREKCLIYTEEELKNMTGELSTDFKKALDFKEHYDIGSDGEKVHYNLWIDEAALPGFRAWAQSYYWEMEKLSRTVLEAMLLGLEVDEEAQKYFMSIHTGHQNGLRLMHYPSAHESTIDRSSLTWCPTHTDFTTYTLLMQDKNQGLEIEDRLHPGTFLQATTEIEDRLYLTIGDFGEIWTNGYLPASRHRVIIPRASDGSDITPKRYSMPYFITPAEDGITGPQNTGKPGTMPPGKYKTSTIKEHIEFRMKFQY